MGLIGNLSVKTHKSKLLAYHKKIRAHALFGFNEDLAPKL